jgi:hypothetical protein
LAGPTGIGKSRLAEKVAVAAIADGATIVNVKASEAEREIEWGFVAMLARRLLRLRGAAGISGASDTVLRSLVPSLSADTGAHVDGRAFPTVALADALADLVGAVSGEAPIVIVLDDCHWSDTASLAVLARVVRQDQNASCFWLLTHRPEEASRELLSLLRSLEREAGAHSFALAPLSRAEVEELLGLMAEFSRPESAGPIAARFHQTTGGNPLFLVELVRELHEEGVVEFVAGRWRLHVERMNEEFRLPRSVQSVVDRRLERLSPEARVLAGYLAHLGRPTLVRDLRQDADLADGAFTRAASELIERQVIRWSEDERLAFAHDQLMAAAARRFPVTARERAPSRAWYRQPRWIAAAVTCAVAVPLGIVGFRRAAPGNGSGSNPLYGGGSVYVQMGSEIFDLRPPRDTNEHWIRREPPYRVPRPGISPRVPAGIASPIPARLVDGRLVWHASFDEPNRDPAVVRLSPDTGMQILVQNEGDDNFSSVSPDGNTVLYSQQNHDAAHYAQDVMLLRAGETVPRRFYRAKRQSAGLWSPDGRRIVVQELGRVDSLFVFTPTGARTASFGFEIIHAAAWCSTADRLSVLAETGTRLQLILVDVESGGIRYVTADGLLATAPLACSPDGRAVLYFAAIEHKPALVVHDLSSGQRTPIVLPVTGRVYAAWLPDRQMPGPTVLDVTGAPSQIDWGGEVLLTSVVHYSDGTVRPIAPTWKPADPSIASVSPAGLLSANRVGRTTIVATYDGWLADTIDVQVAGTDDVGVLLDERLEPDFLRSWYVLDNPVLTGVHNEGRIVLSLDGDNNYLDGIVSRSTWPVERGVTAEMSFRLALTRPEGHSVSMCLWDGNVRAGMAGTSHGEWANREEICFTYPAPRTAKFDPTVAFLGSSLTGGIRVPLPQVLPTDDWTHVALQVRADGRVSLTINRAPVAELPLAITPGRRWRLGIFGASVRTELLVRDIVVWPKPRY